MADANSGKPRFAKESKTEKVAGGRRLDQRYRGDAGKNDKLGRRNGYKGIGKD